MNEQTSAGAAPPAACLEGSHCAKPAPFSGSGQCGLCCQGHFLGFTALRLTRWFEGSGNKAAEACKPCQELYEHAL